MQQDHFNINTDILNVLYYVLNKLIYYLKELFNTNIIFKRLARKEDIL